MAGTPRVRFKGFTDVWEHCKVGEYYDFKNGLNKGKSFFGSGTPIVNFTDVFHNRGLYASDLLGRVTLSPDEISNYEVRQGDIFFTRTSEIIEEIGYPSVMLDAPKSTVFSGFVLRGRANNTDPLTNLFKQYVFFTAAFRLEMIKKSSMTTRALTSGTAIKQMEFFFPRDKDEQDRIGAFFSNLDHLIALHQRKCDEIIELKKYMLQKMFPQNDKKNPEIRFARFIDDWEQRKLGEVFEEYSEKNHPELPPLTIIQGGGTILREKSDRNLQYNKSSLPGYKMVQKDDFIIHLRSFEGGLEKSNSDGVISPAYHTFHGADTDSRFYYPFFRSKHFIDILLKPHVYGIRDGKSIDIDGMKTIIIPVPSYEEQKKIGEYIENLDYLITLHQRKCDALKGVKKFMLQNMFPQKG